MLRNPSHVGVQFIGVIPSRVSFSPDVKYDPFGATLAVLMNKSFNFNAEVHVIVLLGRRANVFGSVSLVDGAGTIFSM